MKYIILIILMFGVAIVPVAPGITAEVMIGLAIVTGIALIWLLGGIVLYRYRGRLTHKQQ